MEKRDYTLVYRVMHWAMAFGVLLVVGTVFLRLTWLNRDHIAGIIQKYLATTDQSLSQDQVVALAKQIRRPMWEWHIYLGYLLVGLYALRLVWSFMGRMEFPNPFLKSLTLKEKLQNGVYLVFYACLGISLLTGLILEFGPGAIKQLAKGIHVLSLYYVLPYILVHAAGVLRAEFTNRPGIISEIVRGSK